MERLKIGYLSGIRVDDQFIGGVMITDSTGIPLEFKYTEPIRPTRIHQIIFGRVLERYIHEEVIKKNLLKEVKNTPQFYFVPEIELLGEDGGSKVPLLALQKTPLPALSGIGEIQRIKDREVLVQPATSTSPLRLTFESPEPDVQEKVLTGIRTFADKMDMMEPFGRVEQALKALCQSKG